MRTRHLMSGVVMLVMAVTASLACAGGAAPAKVLEQHPWHIDLSDGANMGGFLEWGFHAGKFHVDGYPPLHRMATIASWRRRGTRSPWRSPIKRETGRRKIGRSSSLSIRVGSN